MPRAQRTPSRARSVARSRAKPTRVRVGSAEVNRSDLERLRAAWKRKELVLCLGAGVSMPYGLPSWNNLVLELLFQQTRRTRRLRPLMPHYRRAVAAWMTDYFEVDPMVLARMVERDLGQRAGGRGADLAFLENLREHLYANVRRPRGATSLTAVADLIARGTSARGVAAVITFNFDDLLEQELRRKRVAHVAVTGPGRQNGDGLRIHHVHGFVPSRGPLERANVVFTESDYHRLTETVFHWSLSEVVERLRKNTLLFVGLSMSDPNLRRLLDAAHNSDIPAHWQVQKRHAIRDHERAAALQNIDARARDYAEILGLPQGDRSLLKGPDALNAALDAVLAQADTYDREVFESMGVKTIWVDDFAEIPDVLGAIAGR